MRTICSYKFPFPFCLAATTFRTKLFCDPTPPPSALTFSFNNQIQISSTIAPSPTNQEIVLMMGQNAIQLNHSYGRFLILIDQFCILQAKRLWHHENTLVHLAFVSPYNR